jgi:hypothetical protein
MRNAPAAPVTTGQDFHLKIQRQALTLRHPQMGAGQGKGPVAAQGTTHHAGQAAAAEFRPRRGKAERETRRSGDIIHILPRCGLGPVLLRPSKVHSRRSQHSWTNPLLFCKWAIREAPRRQERQGSPKKSSSFLAARPEFPAAPWPKPARPTGRRERQEGNIRGHALFKSGLSVFLGALGVLALLLYFYLGQR